MVLFLLLDVNAHRLKIRSTYRKCPVSGLPCKFFHLWETSLNPKVGTAFQFLDQIGQGNTAAQLKQDVYMIGNTANQNRRTIPFSGDPSKEGMNLLANDVIGQEWEPIFRREDDVQIDAG